MANEDRAWRRQIGQDNYLISTSPNLHDLDFINQAFDTKEMYWASSLPREQLELAVSNSTTLSLFSTTPSETVHKQIGFARIITDRVTFAYLTDVYIQPESQGRGLGQWMIRCCQEIFASMQSTRRVILFTRMQVSKRFYERELGMWETKEEEGLMTMTWKPSGRPTAR